MNSKEKSARTASPQRNRTGCEAAASLAASKESPRTARHAVCYQRDMGALLWILKNCSHCFHNANELLAGCRECIVFKSFLAGVAWREHHPCGDGTLTASQRHGAKRQGAKP